MSDSTTPSEPTIEVRWPQPGAALVVLGGEHDLYSSDSLQRTLDESLAVCHHLIIDISAAEFIDSTVIGVLVRAGQRATEDDHKFNLVLGTAPEVERALQVTGVIPLLHVAPTVEQALAA